MFWILLRLEMTLKSQNSHLFLFLRGLLQINDFFIKLFFNNRVFGFLLCFQTKKKN